MPRYRENMLVQQSNHSMPAAVQCLSQSRIEPLPFWEMNSMFVCPVVGACLTMADQKRILKKTNAEKKDRSDYDLHEILVAMAESENKISARVDRFLRQKYLKKMGHLLDLPQNAFFDAWKELFDSGDLPTAVYAAAAKPGLCVYINRTIFGLIHMGMHESAGVNARLRFELSSAQNRIRQMSEKYDDLALAHRELKKENRSAVKEIKQTRNELVCALKANEKLREKASRHRGNAPYFASNNEGSRDDGHRSNTESGALKNRLDHLERENRLLLDKLNAAREENNLNRQKLAAFLQTCATDMEDCSEDCPSYDLCRKRILIVGGMSKLTEHYRKVIESNGGRFEHHDGNVRGGIRPLESSFLRADVVLCPVDCNSHAACLAVKKLGKKHKKQVRMLFGSSLNAISQALLTEGATVAEPKP